LFAATAKGDFVSRLEQAAYVCLIALCLVAGTVLISDRWYQHKAQVQVPVSITQSLVGKKLDVPGADWNESAMSAVLFLSTECHFCDASMPFYRQLADIHNQRSANRVALLGVSREPGRNLEDHLAQNHVGFDHVYQLPSTFKLLTGTPTLLLVDRTGTIRRAFVGELNAPQEQQLLAFMKTGDLVATVGTSELDRKAAGTL
jgi:thiol-disulfide isomerase/thioredoxin